MHGVTEMETTDVEDEEPPTPHELVSLIKRKFSDLDLTIIIEPGRSIAANAGILVSRVEYLKSCKLLYSHADDV